MMSMGRLKPNVMALWEPTQHSILGSYTRNSLSVAPGSKF